MKKLMRNIAVIMSVLLLLPAMAMADGTQAGTSITNSAEVFYNDGLSNYSSTGSSGAIVVDELVDVTNANGTATTVQPLGVYTSTVYTIINTGNGTSTFDLITSTGGAFTVTSISLYADINKDSDYTNDGGPHTSVTLGNSSTISVIAVVTVPAGATDGQTGTLTITATTDLAFGSYAVGQVVAGGGDGGVEAILGLTAGQAGADANFSVSQVTISIFKTYSTANHNDYGKYPVPGNTVTYFLNISGSGSGYANTVSVYDALPVGVCRTVAEACAAYGSDATACAGTGFTFGGACGSETITYTFGNFSGVWHKRISIPTTIQ